MFVLSEQPHVTGNAAGYYVSRAVLGGFAYLSRDGTWHDTMASGFRPGGTWCATHDEAKALMARHPVALGAAAAAQELLAACQRLLDYSKENCQTGQITWDSVIDAAKSAIEKATGASQVD